MVRNASAAVPGSPQPIPVSVAYVEQRDVPQLAAAIGTVQSLHSVVLRPQVSGIVTDVLFVEGQPVKQGQLLARIDDRSIVAGLHQAQAERASNNAQLKAAKLDQSRYSDLLVKGVVSRQTAERQVALVEQLEAAIAANDATIAAQQVQMSYTQITSPLSGRVGLRNIDPGNLVQAGDTQGLATVTQVDPISVIFTLPQELLPTVQPLMRSPAEAHVVAYDRDRGLLLGEGRLSTIDNQVDAATGTIRLRAEFRNAEGKLWSGQFVTVSLQTGVSRDAMVVPARAVKQGLQGPYVFRVRESRAEIVQVDVAYSNDDIAVIREGVSKDDSVVIDGHSRLTPNALVKSIEPAGGNKVQVTAVVADRQWPARRIGECMM
ncbi:MAG: efflux RND transporter periplasmic adaptor subunit [Steroidobacteraceae bacterium]